MRIRKSPLIPERIRRLPREGWSWVDRRFLRECAAALERDAILLYFFLAAVSDKHGLSYYSDSKIGERLRMSEAGVAQARDQLEYRDLIAYRAPLYQVLSLPSSQRERLQSQPLLLGDILRQMTCQDPAGRKANR